jgi:hypothetical protein
MSFDAVDKLNREFERGYNNGQVKEAVTAYTNDARLFATDKQVYEGLSQIEKYYSNARAAGNSKVELRTGQVIQCGSDYLVEIRLDFSSSQCDSYHLLFILVHIKSILMVEIMLLSGKKMGHNGKNLWIFSIRQQRTTIH